MTQEALDRYDNKDGDARGRWQSVAITAQAGHGTKSQFYTITTPSGREVTPPSGNCWRFTKKKLDELIANDLIWFGADGNNVPRQKMFLEEQESGLTPHTLWKADEVGTTDSAKRALNELFSNITVFDTPKPVELIERIIKISDLSDGLFMDFFAGSCVTAEAVFSENAQDGGQRKAISIQLPEYTDHSSEAHKAGYKTIADIGKERIRRAAQKIQTENPDYKGDLGFKVLKLDQSNFKQWQAPARITSDDDLIQQMELHIDHVQEAADPEAILYELLIKAGFMPTEKVETLTLAGKTVYSIADGALLICLEDEINHDLIQAVANAEPTQFICLDKAFGGNDQLKANAVQTFKALNQNREVKIEFRTV